MTPLPEKTLRIPVLCALVLVVVGVDTYGIGYVAPYLSASTGITPPELGVIFTATVVASLLGAIGIAPLSDLIGRRRVLLLALLLAGVPSAVVPLVSNFHALIGLRFLVGLGFGASIPVAVALVSEAMPGRHHALSVTTTSSAIVAGMALAGMASGLLIPRFGWESVLYTGTALSVLTAVVIWIWLPESPRLQPQRIGALRMSGEAKEQMLEGGALPRSLLLGLLMTMSYLVLNFLAYWLPTILLNAGIGVQATGFIGSGRQIFTVLLGFGVGWLMDRAGIGRVLTVCYTAAATLFFVIAALELPPLRELGVLLFGVSLFSAGLSGSLVHVTGFFTPVVCAIALGWLQGSGRVIGGSLGTLLGGLLIGAGWTHGRLAGAMGVAAVIAVAALLITLLRRPPKISPRPE
jgi:AAHS family 4-hydroxybenzoate transporter-like MFS transporter